ncbi:MAG TPA: cell wall hydrolase [Firmicutes bacterium]|nr:cell wall hydrolase [Bacillota bacterium]
MKRIRKSSRGCVCLLLSAAIGAVQILPVQAAGTGLEEASERVESAEAQATTLEEAQRQLEGYLSDLNTQLDELGGDLEDLAGQQADLDARLSETRTELADARATEEEQYEAMKKRIQYMYENRDAGFFSLIFSEDSLSDILNKAEYAMEMASYDRRMLTAYKETKDLVSQKESDLLAEQEELDRIVSETQTKQNEILAAIGETGQKIEESARDLEDAENQLAQYRAELQQRELEAEERMAALESETLTADSGVPEAVPDQPEETEPVREPEAPDREPAQTEPAEPEDPGNTEDPGNGNEDVSGGFDYSAYSDLELMAAMIYREANTEPWEGKVAVGNVIMNRLQSSRYPDTMIGVLSQPYQFTPWGSAGYIRALQNGVNSTCMQAAQAAMNGTENYIGNLLHFRMVAPGYTGIIIGNHVFY